MTQITDHIVIPVSTPDDARNTARQVQKYDFDTITVVHVIEQVKNAPDPISPELGEKRAAKAFGAFKEVIPTVGTKQIFRADVVEGVLDFAKAEQASTIVFCPRGGSRVVQFLSGDVALRLVTEADRPVIALPQEDDQ